MLPSAKLWSGRLSEGTCRGDNVPRRAHPDGLPIQNRRHVERNLVVVLHGKAVDHWCVRNLPQSLQDLGVQGLLCWGWSLASGQAVCSEIQAPQDVTTGDLNLVGIQPQVELLGNLQEVL